ncbi:preprotein translocase subunit SecG [Helicobacter winghamensis]|uniref:Protein-export membrane protein SecG n=1 Tax=Helicobacter winghamensis TaxID=157268 RepID=A0A2N3PIM4_9HELI|nr:preprotein translocase subunit SecG [Helicobacter winghamensis]EEO25623.1 preprotein translocase, SecG subunit [Helicobacter winghamensis ATCC BAA-430]PKT76110.1 preprotein translocase subunit SecG [Helicobacter winghamensis]PKT76745.1 preprotein translocase subunit SecG [Helicobacter winghamensis]PKT76866.1 preprotein translocase subunit SecG [Helicobacter winghamensis]PKT80621.1 preprotein translocase subunit SecG [Helicobacter winghamensis]
MSGILLILQFVLAILITIVVMMQKSSSMGLGAYSGSNESLFGAKGPAGFLVKLTFALGLLFVLNTIALGYLYMQDAKRSIIDGAEIPASSVPAVPVAPAPLESGIPAQNTESK